MKIAITGGTGLVGRFLVEAALAGGHRVTVLGRTAPEAGFFSAPVTPCPFDLAKPGPDLTGQSALVHAAFHHEAGKYRGGEGDDPDGFTARNLIGTIRLFAAAKAAGVARCLFLSSRAVYGGYPAGTPLTEAMPPRPDTLYGRVKAEAEQALLDLEDPDFLPLVVRATGVYGPAGPGRRHKWADLFDAFHQGAPIAPRAGTELHGEDLAQAVLTLLRTPRPALPGRVFHASDLLLDRQDLLRAVARRTGCTKRLPDRAAADQVSVMATARLRSLGWQPGGWPLLEASLAHLL